MRRIIVCAWLVGCSSGGADDELSMVDPPEDHGDAVRDREECEAAAREGCPGLSGVLAGAGPWQGADGIIGLDAAGGEPVCGGRGLFLDSEALGQLPNVAVKVVSNPSCHFVCFSQCAFESLCWADGADGERCVDACTQPSLTKDECEAFVAECLGNGVSCDE